MSRAEGIGLGLALIGHVVLFAILSLVWLAPKTPLVVPKPIEVSLVDKVALEQHAPAAPEPPSQSTAPDPGPPQDAPPPAKAAEVAPDPAPPKPQPEAVPPPKPMPKPNPAPKKPVTEKADKPDKTKAPAAKAAAPSTKAVAATKGNGTDKKATKAKASGSLLDDDFRKGLSQSPSKSRASEAAPGAVMNAQAAANIASAIQRQVQPCANRQVIPGPGASRIVAIVRLQLNRDGTLAARPSISADHRGVDDDNRIYIDAVDRAAVSTFTQCAPLRGLPAELYDVPRGWKTFTMTYHMPG